MKRILLILLALTLSAAAQNSDRSVSAQLTSTCSNATTTCDTAGTTVFGPQGDVLGPQTIETNVQGYGLATVSASGTFTGSSISFEFSDDGGTTWYPTTCTRTDTNIQEGSEALANSTNRAFDCGVGASTRFRVRQTAIGSGGPVVRVTLTSGIVEPAPTVQLSQAGTVGANPCQNPHANLQTITVAMSTTTRTQFIALSAGTKIYGCSAIVANSSATATVAISQGTGSNCATGTATIIDAFTMPASTASPVTLQGPILFVGTSGAALCYTLTGTTPTGTLTLNYIQQ